MKVLSLLQPWATLVVIGAKKFETRSWATKYRGPLLIHASKKVTKADRELSCEEPFRDALTANNGTPVGLPLGAIIGKVELVDCLEIGHWHPRNGGPLITLNGRAVDLPHQEVAFGNYNPGRFAWKLENFHKFVEPISAKGSLGIWEFPESALGHLAEAGAHD